jgi:hypothetical protein
MTTNRIGKPTPAVVRIVAFFAVGFVALSLVAQLVYVAVLAPLLPDNFEINFSARATTSEIMATPSGLAIAGWIFVVVGAAAAALATRRGARGAYGFGVMVCLVMPAFACNLLGNTWAVLNGIDGTGPAVFALIAGVALGAAAIILAPRLADREAAE